MNWYKRSAAILTATIFAGLLMACGKPVAQVGGADETSMFVEVERASAWRVVYNKNTGVMYAVSNGDYNRGMFTLLVNADGSPMIYGG